jgi:hypothetical protein
VIRRVGLVIAALLALGASGVEPSGSIEAGVDVRPREALLPDQVWRDLAATVAATLKVQGAVAPRVKAEAEVFARAHGGAERKVATDVREASLTYTPGGGVWELRAGVLRVHWGVLEAQNPLDIVNQRDLVEDWKGQTKLGQPGLELRRSFGDQAQLGVLLLPYFRERRLAEGRDRFRFAGLPFADRATFDSDRGRHHLDAAAELKWYAGSLDVAISQFWGTSREPRFAGVEVDPRGRVALVPRYDIVAQTGLSAQWIQGDTTWKVELARQRHPSGAFYDAGAGVEQAIPTLFGSRWSATLYLEYYHSTRSQRPGVHATTLWDRDVFLGMRLARNDFNQTEFELQSVFDLRTHATLLTLKARTSPGGGNWFIALEADFFLRAERDRALGPFRRDHRIRATLSRFF